jgi:L-iditol 2-dehydrogenase
MKSLVLERPNELALLDRPVPQPASGEVLIRVRSASICHTDFIPMRGEFPGCKYPTVLGHEFSGVVEQCGSGVTTLEPGDPVACMAYGFCGTCRFCRSGRENGCENTRAIPFQIDGAYQELMCLSAASAFKFGRPLSFGEAAVTECAANGCSAVERCHIEPGEHVVVIGPGPVGLLAVQFAKLRSPSTLTIVGTRDERLKVGEDSGATHTVNVRKTDPYEAIMEITDHHGADVVILCAGTEDAWELASRSMAMYGRIAVEALPERADSRWPVPVFKMTALHMSYLGVCGYTAAQFAATLKLMEEGTIDVSKVITHTFGLEEYTRAFDTADRRLDGAIKVVIEVSR